VSNEDVLLASQFQKVRIERSLPHGVATGVRSCSRQILQLGSDILDAGPQ
jgi:hypothetical protein